MGFNIKNFDFKVLSHYTDFDFRKLPVLDILQEIKDRTDFRISLENLSYLTNEHGTNYNLVLEHMDRLVVWGYYGVDNYPPEYLQEVAHFLTQFHQDKLILSIGLWDDNGQAVSPESFRTAIQSVLAGGIDNIWITPSLLMNDANWQTLADFWGGH